jgi:glycosyltransferase involved in cell wall biosynthesis
MTESGTVNENRKTRTVAVIVPVYNAAATLKRCTDSILGQTYRDLEVWLIDDGSADESAAMCDALAESDCRVHVIHKTNEGLMATWMRGVRESSAPYLCFVDSDDWIERNMISDMAEQLPCPEHPERERKEAVCCSYRIDREWNHTSEKKGHAAAPGIYEEERLKKELQEKILGNEQRTMILSRCMKLFSRELIESNLHYCDPAVRMGEDINITVPALLDAEKIVILPEAWYYHYTFLSESMVHKYDAGLYDNICRLRRILTEILKDRAMPDAEQMIRREFLFLFFIEMKNELRSSDTAAPARIRELCRKEDSPALLQCYPYPLADRADRLIAFFMKKPVMGRILPVRWIFRWQGRDHGRQRQ